MLRTIEKHMFLWKQAVEFITSVKLLIPEDLFVL